MESGRIDEPTKRHRLVLASAAVSIMVLCTATICEITLHLAAHAFPQVAIVLFPPRMDQFDSELEFRGIPHPEHDANGFRNSHIPGRADIVAIGDSITYGTSVDFEQAWPRVLEKLTSCQVYSMAFGGYGPIQYATLAREAMQFNPRLILVGIYFGNDFYDNWEMYLRNPQKYFIPENLLTPALELERSNPLSREDRLLEDNMVQANPSSPLKQFLSQYSSVWGFGRAVRNQLFAASKRKFETAVGALTPKQLEAVSVFEGSSWKTIFISPYRHLALNQADPRIEVGYRLTEWAVQDIDRVAKQNGVGSIFILLPTKESVFAPKVQNKKEHVFFETLTIEEDVFRRRLIEHMQLRNIAYVDMTPLLSSMEQQPYFENGDGHPNAIGQNAIATKLLEHVFADARPAREHRRRCDSRDQSRGVRSQAGCHCGKRDPD
jgi:lysophospholipase L1-like esterase